jgi:hypothetical protein
MRGRCVNADSSIEDRAWFITQRWQQYEGEARANLLRIAAVGVFYLLHLWNYLGSQGKLPQWGVLELSKAGTVDRRFHLMATLLALGWAAAAAAVHLALRSRVFPRWISAASTGVDLVMLTSVLCISSGPQSALVAGYFLIIVLSGLRFSLPLVRLATLGAVAGYLCILGMAKWPARFGRESAGDLRVPRYEQLVVIAALLLCGLFVGQLVRRTRGVARDYCSRIASAKVAPP